MGCGEKCASVFGICCLFGLSLICQGVGLFTPRWVTLNATADCNLGLVTSSCDSDEADEVNKAVLGLEITSFIVILFTNIALFGLMCGEGDEDDDSLGICGCCAGCCGLLYPIAGVLTLVGCIISATEYSTSQFGWSFYLCIAAGCYILIESICLCCAICVALRDNDDKTTSSGHENTVSYTNSSNDLEIGGQRRVPTGDVNAIATFNRERSDNTTSHDRSSSVAATDSSRNMSAPNHRYSIRGLVQETEVQTIATNNGIMLIAKQVTRMIHLRSE